MGGDSAFGGRETRFAGEMPLCMAVTSAKMASDFELSASRLVFIKRGLATVLERGKSGQRPSGSFRTEGFDSRSNGL